jgi:hypothetical protein
VAVIVDGVSLTDDDITAFWDKVDRRPIFDWRLKAMKPRSQ